MLGAIIGDLAASTYLRDKDEFHAHLIGKDATVSELIVAVLWTIKAVCEWNHLNDDLRLKQFIAHLWSAERHEHIELPEEVREWTTCPNMWKHHVGVGMFLMRQGTYSYWFDWESGKRDRIDFGMDKEEMYASMFLSKMLTLLRLGWTKEEVWRELGGVFQGCFKDWQWKTETGKSLSYLFRAWDSFNKAFDFGSAIHNAVRMVGDLRLNCALTGMIAAAMYGCGQYFIKERYDHKHQSTIQLEIPKFLYEDYSNELECIKKQLNWVNVFWAKNDSRTNIERHTYTHIDSRFNNMRVSGEIHRRILKSFAPDWEHRFSFYKDNGWVYLCRSGFILGRFRFRYDNGDFIIKDIQGSGFDKNIDGPLHDIISSIKREWPLLTDLFKYYSCYSTEYRCPDAFKGTIKEKFWEGERSFFETQMDNLGKWIGDGRKAIDSSDDPRLISMAKRLGSERFGVVFYINTLFAKWNPWDSMEWIFEY